MMTVGRAVVLLCFVIGAGLGFQQLYPDVVIERFLWAAVTASLGIPGIWTWWVHRMEDLAEGPAIYRKRVVSGLLAPLIAVVMALTSAALARSDGSMASWIGIVSLLFLAYHFAAYARNWLEPSRAQQQ